MQDLALTYPYPLTTNPLTDWLGTYTGVHFVAVQAFHEACWAWEGVHSQRDRKPDDCRWQAPKKLYRWKPQIYEYALKKRQQSLKVGFFDLTQEHLEELLALPIQPSNQQHILDRFIALCDRHDETEDLYGQLLPATHFEILHAVDRARPYQKQGLCALTKKIRLNGQAYFAKLTDETLSGQPPIGQDEFNDVTTHMALRTLCPVIAPAAGFHLINADGQQCSLIAAIPGETYDEEDGVDARHLGTLIDTHWLQWIVLAEWLFGIGDRLMGNMVINPKKRCAGIIDATFGWNFHPTFLGWEEDEDMRICYSFARELWEAKSMPLLFPRQLIGETVSKEQQVLVALAPFPMPARTLALLHAHCDVLRSVLAQQAGDISLDAIEHVAQNMIRYA